MNLIVNECCEDKALNEVCGECRLDLMVFFLNNKARVMKYLLQHDPKLWREINSANFQL